MSVSKPPDDLGFGKRSMLYLLSEVYTMFCFYEPSELY